MSTGFEPRLIGLVGGTSSSGRPRELPTDTTHPEVLDRLAVWLAEVSAEAVVRRPASEAEPTSAEPTS